MPCPCCSEDVCCPAGRGTAGAGARRYFGPIELTLEVLSYCLADRHRRQVHMGLDPGGRIRLLQPVYEPCGRQGCVTHKWQEVGEKTTTPRLP